MIPFYRKQYHYIKFFQIFFLLYVLFNKKKSSSLPLDGCSLLIYTNSTDSPVVKNDTHGICPQSKAPRAFAFVTLLHFMTSDRAKTIKPPSSISQLKEIAPDGSQEFYCLKNSKCILIVRGFWLHAFDTIAVLPKGRTTCPPQNESLELNAEINNGAIEETNGENKAIVVQAFQSGTIKNPYYADNEAWMASFQLPERVIFDPGNYTVCYSPFLASRIQDSDLIDYKYFHYNVGKLRIGTKLFECSFDKHEFNDNENIKDRLPCGFRNYQSRLNILLQWQLGSGRTETPGTGPSGDITHPLGKGNYLFMDSPGFAAGAAATVISPPFSLNSGSYCTKFAYSMYGPDVSTFRVYLHKLNLANNAITNTTENVTMLGLWGFPRWVAVGNKGDAWHQGGFDFRVNGLFENFELVFEAIAGESEQGDIAIDDIKITPGSCPMQLLSHTPRSIDNKLQPYQPIICGEVRLNTGIHATDKAWRVEKAVSCAGRGYSLDQINSVWLPCCVPHFGAYTLVLQDALGDGWTGSYLEFRFFDKIMTFGKNDDFVSSGQDRLYTLVIGSFEIVGVSFVKKQQLVVHVRVSRPNSYAWCGVVKAAPAGEIVKVDLTTQLLKKYGVRSAFPTQNSNEIVNVTIRKLLTINANYDLYCYSEVIGDLLDNSVSQLYDEEKINKEIVSSRMRVTIDDEPPKIMITSLHSTHNSINVTFTSDETAKVWCLPEPAPPRSDPLDFVDPLPLFSTEGSLAGTLDAKNLREAQKKVSGYFKTMGTTVSLASEVGSEDGTRSPVTAYVTLTGLVPGLEYDVLCYAEDTASPNPNMMTPSQVQETARPTRTESKKPKVTILRHRTLLKGFRLSLELDAPGQVWCAAAPEAYDSPQVYDVVQAGAYTNTTSGISPLTVDIRGVEPNTIYKIYCVAGLLSIIEPSKELDKLTTQEEMKQTSVSVISYGRYCDTETASGPHQMNKEVVTYDLDFSPFHPIRTEEELRIRDFMLSRADLNLHGLYRINTLPNKTEIYDFYDNNGPKPERYARVRAGRCVDGIGYYEQFRVGPLSTNSRTAPSAPMTYKRLARPVETECGGYNPQGVFGRRLLSELQSYENILNNQTTHVSLNRFYDFIKDSFGYTFPGLNKFCPISDSLKASKMSRYNKTNGVNTTVCLQYGPLILEELCNETLVNTTCRSSSRDGRLWLGLKTMHGDKLPLFFVFNLTKNGFSMSHTNKNETAQEWAKRIIQNKEIPEDFYALWEADKLWYHGHFYSNINSLLEAVESGKAKKFTPEIFQKSIDEKETIIKEDINRQKRKLEPSPYPGAAGTAGPILTREKRRVGLEYLSHPEHIEAQGTRFRLKSSRDMEVYTLDHSGWFMTLTNDRDTGLRIFNLRFLDKRIAFEMGVMEALAHYTVSERNWFFLDSWYGGLGSAARHVHKGIECPKTGVSVFWDGSLCVFEQDLARPLRSHWRSGELRLGAPHTVLVLRQMLTVSNYDYVTDYRFHPTGMIDASVSFTGELYAGVEVPWYSNRQHDYGTQVTGAMRFAALHSHVLSWKIDFDIGEKNKWNRNSVLLTEVVQDPNRPEANKLLRTFAEREHDAALFRNNSRPIIYEVVDESIDNFGNVGGFRVHPYEGINPFNHNSSLYSGPAAWAKYRVASTVRKYSELDITLPRDNKFAHRPAVTLDRYIEDNEPIRHVDIVTWISDGIFHVPVTEDMPLTIPVGNLLGWLVKPSNLFHEDPSMDLYNAQGGGVRDPGTCAVVRMDIGEVEPSLNQTWKNINAMLGLL